MRSTITAGGSPDFASQRGAYRFEARRGASYGRRGQRAEGSRGAAEQILARRERHQEPALATRRERASEAIARRVLVAIRVAMGLVFVACGLSGFVDFTPAAHAGQMHGSAMAFGGALLVAGSLLPLLKGTEVIVETVLELQRAFSTQRSAERS